MWGIPDWAVGVAVILLSGSGALVMMVRLLGSGSRARALKGDEREQLGEMQARLGELDELKLRVGELEERVEFAERLLARPKD